MRQGTCNPTLLLQLAGAKLLGDVVDDLEHAGPVQRELVDAHCHRQVLHRVAECNRPPHTSVTKRDGPLPLAMPPDRKGVRQRPISMGTPQSTSHGACAV